MKTIGLIGGTSWESTVTYYQQLNEITNRKLGGLHSARCILYSLEFGEIIDLLEKNDWDGASAISIAAAQTLEKAGADFILLCANTAHKSYDQIQEKIGIPILHIAQVVAARLKQEGLKKVGLLGTKYTMGEDFYKPYLLREGLEVCVVLEKDMELVNSIIYDELCKGVVSASSKELLLGLCRQMHEDGAEAVILGCTELGLILHDGEAGFKFYDTVQLHCEAAVEMSLNQPGV